MKRGWIVGRGARHVLYVFLMTCTSFSTLFSDSFNSVGARTSHEEVTKFQSIQISMNSSQKLFLPQEASQQAREKPGPKPPGIQ
jgi:hypothetical protein